MDFRFVRLAVLLFAGATALAPYAHSETLEVPEGFMVVAHRGVVTDAIPENSLASLEATIARGYTHIEVDIRPTKDGHPVCLHDPGMYHATGIRRNVDTLTLAELRELVPEEKIPSFETFCERCKGRIAIMVDFKRCREELREPCAKRAAEAMEKHGLLDTALFIGRSNLFKDQHGKGRLSWGAPYEIARDSDLAKNNPGKDYFAFGHAEDFDAEAVKGFHAMGVSIVVSINTFHYRKGDPIEQGRADVRRMIEYGVDGLQIDSVYDDLVLDYEKKP